MRQPGNRAIRRLLGWSSRLERRQLHDTAFGTHHQPPPGETACYLSDLTSAVDGSASFFEASSTVITSEPPPPGVPIIAMGQLDQPPDSPVAYEWSATTEAEFTIGTVSAPDPTAAFTFQQDLSGGPLNYAFDGSTSTAFGGNTITNYSWDFGDGTTATGVSPTHLFSTGGTYQVTLTVTDSAGNIGSITQVCRRPSTGGELDRGRPGRHSGERQR